MVLDGEGEFYSCFCDVCLGSIDKELKVGVVVMGSVLIVLGIFWQRELRVEVMDLVGGFWGVFLWFCCVLVLLNLCGGKGKVLQFFWSYVQFFLVEVEIFFMLMFIEWWNYVWELVWLEELGCWDVLVVMFGDGLMYEVVNGFMEWFDWEIVIQKFLCSFLVGFGNVLVVFLNYYVGYEQVINEDFLINCMWLLCCWLLLFMNLLFLYMVLGLCFFFVLSLVWGFIVDVDLESEKYWCLGEMCFILGIFLCLVVLCMYCG